MAETFEPTQDQIDEPKDATLSKQETTSTNNQSVRDLRNIQVVEEILVAGDPSELKQLADFYDLDPAQIELYVKYSRLRNDVLMRMAKEVEQRKTNNPKATVQELSLGAYKENLEPQVREAVLLLRNKGYPTYESGFYGPPENVQKIGFQEDCLDAIDLPKSLVAELSSKGVRVQIDKRAIELTCEKYLDTGDLTHVWNSIAEVLPNRGRPAADTALPFADLFRSEQSKL